MRAIARPRRVGSPGPILRSTLVVAAGALALLACDSDNDPLLGTGGGGGGGGISGPRDSAVASLLIWSGDAQNGRTLETFRGPIRVFVQRTRGAFDARGDSVPGARVEWEIIEGVGSLSALSSVSDTFGLAEVLASGGPVLGPLRVRARSVKAGVEPVTFELQVTAVQVQILADRFSGPFGSDTVHVVAGDTIEWLNRDPYPHLLRSVEAPDGGSLIRSDTLRNSQRYAFVPNRAGTWVYEDQVGALPGTGARGVVVAAGRGEVGALQVEVVLAAGDPPARGFLATVDGGILSAPVSVGETVIFPVLTAIPHFVRLGSLPANCAVAGENPRSVPIVAGDTVSTRFEVGCQ
ncbi:MAG: hypothetical protein R6X22_01485 [Gemmatimonadota bacterium]